QIGCFSPDGKIVFSIGASKLVARDLKTGCLQGEPVVDGNGFAIVAGGERGIAPGSDGTPGVFIWDLTNGRLLEKHYIADVARCTALPDGRVILQQYSGHLVFWDSRHPDDGKVFSFELKGYLWPVSVSGDGSRVAIG